IAAAKLAVGLSISSVALVGDGLHSCVDALATALTLAAVRWASKPPDREHPYGHGRAENLSALGQATLMTLLAAGVAFEAIHRLRTGAEISVRAYALLVIVLAVAIDAARAAVVRLAARR